MEPSSQGASTLSLLGRKFRQERPLFFPPDVSVRDYGAAYAEIWFPSGGCHYDALGQCTMCNYGRSRKVTDETMIAAVRSGLTQLKCIPKILWVSAFNVLDDNEVSPTARQGIFKLLGNTSVERVIFETHPLTVSAEKIRDVQKQLQGKSLGIEIGVESMSDFVRKWCINKQLTSSELETAIRVILDCNALPYINLLLGAPFLTVNERQQDVLQSTDKLIELGVKHICVFPNHIKQFTVIEQLNILGRYEPVSLWALVEIITNAAVPIRDCLYYAWFTDVSHPGKPVSIPPLTSQDVHSKVISLLDSFLVTRNNSIISELRSLRSPSRDDFLKKLAEPPQDTLPHRIVNGIKILCDSAFPGYFTSVAQSLSKEIENDWLVHRNLFS